MGRRHVREKKTPTEAEKLAALPRAKPGMDRVRHSRRWSSRDGITVRVSVELPPTILRMRAKGMLTADQVRAAEMLIADYERGYASGMGSVQYRERVDGGGAGSDYVAAAVLSARARYDEALAGLPGPIAEVVVGVLVRGAVLTEAGQYSQRYSQPHSRRVCASTMLGIGLMILAENYGLTKVHKEE